MLCNLCTFHHHRHQHIKPRLHDTTCCQTSCRLFGAPQVKCLYTPVKCVYTRYNRLSNRLSNRFNNRLYRVYKHSTGCQTRNLTSGLTTGCIVYTAGCQTCCTSRYDNRLNEQYNRLNEQWLFVQHGCQTALYNRFDNRFDNRLDVCVHDTARLTTGCRPIV